MMERVVPSGDLSPWSIGFVEGYHETLALHTATESGQFLDA